MPARSLDQIVNLCKRRGFVFPGSAAYGGLGSFWDYGPLGVEMLRNVKEAWWKDSVYARDDMEGLDAAILMSRKVWQHSGHEATFSDPLVDCKKCRSRFRGDHFIEDMRPAMNRFMGELVLHAERVQYLFEITSEPVVLALQGFQRKVDEWDARKRSEDPTWSSKKFAKLVVDLMESRLPEVESHETDPEIRRYMEKFKAQLLPHSERLGKDLFKAGYFRCPQCGSNEFTPFRNFNLMFKTHVGPVEAAPSSDEEKAHRVYLRPETAQGIFMNFAHVQRAMARKVPFGIAQMGKAFRNEITPGNFIFRTREFEQMEIEFFIKPPQFVQEGEKTDEEWHREWIDRRYEWWLKYAGPSMGEDTHATRFRKREQTPDELAHYAKATTDIEYLFPGSLGWGEIEGVANRTDYDLTAHSKDVPEDDLKRLKLEPNKDSNEKFDYFDPDAKQRYIPWVIEPSAGVTRAVLTFLCEAYHEEMVSDPTKQEVDQVKSDVAMIIKNAEKKIKQAEKDAEKGNQPKHDPAAVQAFIDKLAEARDGLPDSLMAVEDAFNHEGAQNLEPVKKFRPWLEKLVERVGRRVLRLHPALAPVKLAVFPLKKNKPELVELAKSIKARFNRDFRVVYDDSAGIGRLYRRQDEIGTPFCITVDFQSLEDDTVTVRERDSMEQVRVSVDELEAYLLPRLR